MSAHACSMHEREKVVAKLLIAYLCAFSNSLNLLVSLISDNEKTLTAVYKPFSGTFEIIRK